MGRDRGRVARVTRTPRRGDVYFVALDPVMGSEIRKTRPAVIVSNDICNRYGPRVVILPLTSNVSACYPGEVLVTVKGKPGRALGDQIRSIDKARLQTRAGTVTPEELTRIDEALAITLALPMS